MPRGSSDPSAPLPTEKRKRNIGEFPSLIQRTANRSNAFFSGNEALEYGLVSKVSDSPLDDAILLAQKICQQSPDAIAATKYIFKKTWKKDTRLALLWERITQLRLLGRKNQRIAMKNGLSKSEKKKDFIDRTSF